METRKCVQCGETFTITDSEKQFYEDRNLQLPKRCKKCREKNNPKQIETKQIKTKQIETKPYQGAPKNSRIFINEKTLLIVLVLAFIFCIIRITNNTSSSDYKGAQDVTTSTSTSNVAGYTFRSESLLQEHFIEHGQEFGYTDSSQYLQGANAVINSANTMTKIEAEDGDTVYYIQQTNEFVILSTDHYIRTYFRPEDGIDYYNRQ